MTLAICTIIAVIVAVAAAHHFWLLAGNAMIRLYIALGIFGALVLSHGAAYLKGRLDVSDKARIEQLERDLKAVQDAYEQEQKARRLDADQAMRDRKDADLEAITIKELEDALDDPDADVFGAPDADRMRELINRQNPRNP